MRRAGLVEREQQLGLGEADQVASVDDLAAVAGEFGTGARGLRTMAIEPFQFGDDLQRGRAVVGRYGGERAGVDVVDAAEPHQRHDLAERHGGERQQRQRHQRQREPAQPVVAGEEIADEIVDGDADRHGDDAAEGGEEEAEPAALAGTG